MSLITIAADLPNLDQIISKIEKAGTGAGLTYTKQAVKAATESVIQRTWIEYASGVQVTYSGGTFKINVVSGQYLQSIQNGIRYPEDLTGEVFSTSPHAELIEHGQPAHDMKPGLLASPKAKYTKPGKDGKRTKYVTVPFRHGTPGAAGIPAMPKHIYEQASQLGYSRRNSILKAFFTGRKHTWNGRLRKSTEGQRSHIAPHPGAGYTWKTGQYSGMVHMGSKHQGHYLTFRRVSENSDPRSWQHPGVAPRPITEAVVENTKEEVLALIRRGFEMDLYFLGLGGG